ncbi:hypothetical protein [Streptomyces sp. NPDC054804]
MSRSTIAALTGKRVVIYNAPFDVGRLRYELTRHYTGNRTGQGELTTAATGDVAPGEPPQAVSEAAAKAADWIEQMRFEDAMEPYAAWVGEWSDYWGDYVWQRLPGGDNRALGDCIAVVAG